MAFTAAYVAVAAVVLLVAKSILKRLAKFRQAWRTFNTIPGPAASSTVMGHFADLVDEQAPVMVTDWANKFGPLFKLRMATQRVVILTDPAAIQRIVKRGPNYLKKAKQAYAPITRSLVPPMPAIASAEDGPVHQAVRHGTASCFSTANLKQVFPFVLDLSKRTAAKFHEAGPAASIDVAQKSKLLTSDVIGKLLFDTDLGGVESNDRAGKYVAAAQGATEAVVHYTCDPLRHLRFWDARSRADHQACVEHDACVAAKVQEILQQPPPDWTIAGQLLKVRLEDGSPLSFQQLKAEVAMFLAAGFDTTANGLSWALGLLAAHPEAQEKLAAELDAAGLLATPERPNPRDFEWSDLGRLPWMSAVIRETLRMMSPIGMGTARITDKEVQLCGHSVPKDTIVFCPFYALGRSRANYGQTADQFQPQRWLQGTSTAQSQPQHAADSYLQGSSDTQQGDAGVAVAPGSEKGAGSGPSGSLPDPMTFSMGPRDCPGQSLARLELQVALATFVGRFKFELGPELQSAGGGMAALQARMVYRITTQAKDGMPLLAVPRCTA